MSNIGARGSENANEWAMRKKEQIESAKRLREERKQASLLKNVGEKFVLKPQSNGNYPGVTATGALLSTSSSGFSQKSSYSGPQQQQYPPSGMSTSASMPNN